MPRPPCDHDRPPVETLDARGYRCPMPVIRMEARLRALAPGAVLKVLADDPVAVVDIPHFCREGGWRVERLPDEGGACVFLVARGEKPRPGAGES